MSSYTGMDQVEKLKFEWRKVKLQLEDVTDAKKREFLLAKNKLIKVIICNVYHI